MIFIFIKKPDQMIIIIMKTLIQYDSVFCSNLALTI